MTFRTSDAPTPVTSETRRVGKVRRLWIYAVRGFLALLLLCGIWMGVQQLIGNFHTVVAGQLYRAARFDASEIAGFQKDYGIRTIINLRGPDSSDWYKQQIAQSEALGITHFDFRLSASKELTQGQVEALIAMMRNAPKPILVHCTGGADRSGIAAALYLGAIAKAGEYAAEWQLSPFYGHIPLPFAPAWAMDETWERIEPWLGFPNS